MKSAKRDNTLSGLNTTLIVLPWKYEESVVSEEIIHSLVGGFTVLCKQHMIGFHLNHLYKFMILMREAAIGILRQIGRIQRN